MRVKPYVYFQCRCEEALEFYRQAICADTTVLASDGGGAGQPDFSRFSLSLTVSDDAGAERLFSSLSYEGDVQVPMAPTPFASRLGLVADKFGVPWMGRVTECDGVTYPSRSRRETTSR